MLFCFKAILVICYQRFHNYEVYLYLMSKNVGTVVPHGHPGVLPFSPPPNPPGHCVTRRDVVFLQDSNAWRNAKTISKKIASFYTVNLHLFYTNATLRNICSVFFSIIWWISFWTSAHWASFGCLQLCNISNPKKPGDYRVLYLPQVPVNARVNRKPTLVDPCIFAVHPCSSDTRRLFEHMHVKHIQFTCEMSSRRESCSSGSDHTHSQELPHSFIRGMFS